MWKKIILSVVVAVAPFFLFSSSVGAQTVQCPYQSTQARVQNNASTSWSPSITVGCERTFNVGSFHNGVDQFATDTTLQVVGPNNFAQYVSNGQTITAPTEGIYYLFASTGGQFAPGCYEVAQVNVACNSTPSASPTPVCPYTDTQARVQKDDKDPWKPSMTLSCGQTFRVGSFHNGVDRFAEDTQLKVTGPQVLPFGLLKLDHTFKNADTLRALFPGTYTLAVTTPGKSGAACEQRATVEVSCTPNWWLPQ